MSGHVLGIDIGGTKIAGALVDARGRVASARVIVPTEGERGAEHILDRVVEVAGRVQEGAPEPASLVGVGSAGTFDAAGRVVSSTDSLRDWAGTDVQGALRSRLGVAVHVLNDVHAFALAESELGAARGAGSVLAVAVGTGIGGAFVDRGRLLVGATGSAGAVGHVGSPFAEGLPCSCGRTGHIEAIAAGPAIERSHARALGSVLPLEEIARRARLGDLGARKMFATAGRALGRSLADLGSVLDPDVIVLGGGVMNAIDLLGPALRDEFAGAALPGPGRVRIVGASFRGDGVVIGAAVHAGHQSATRNQHIGTV
jgi:glucokinase